MDHKKQNKQANNEMRKHKTNKFCLLKLKLTFLGCWTFLVIKRCCFTRLAVFPLQFIITFGTHVQALPAKVSCFRTSFFAVCSFTTKLNFAKGKLNRGLSIGKKAMFGAFALPQSLKEKDSHPLQNFFPPFMVFKNPPKLYQFSNERSKGPWKAFLSAAIFVYHHLLAMCSKEIRHKQH